MIQTTSGNMPQVKARLLHSPGVTVARLTLDSYLRSGWMWGEFVLVIVCFAALFFPYLESTIYFNGTAIFCLSAIAILGPAVMVRQATSARTYLLLARLTSRAAYCRGLMLAAAALRIPLYAFFLALVLIFHRLNDFEVGALLWGAFGLILANILVALLTVGLCSPMATRVKRIYFLTWLAVMLFSFKPVLPLPDWLESILSITQLPLWPVQECYALGSTGNFDLLSLLAVVLMLGYYILVAFVAGYWLEKRELLLY